MEGETENRCIGSHLSITSHHRAPILYDLHITHQRFKASGDSPRMLAKGTKDDHKWPSSSKN